MSHFLQKPNSIKKSDILSKYYSLHPSEHKKVIIANDNLKTISSLQTFEGVGEQIDVSEYLNFKSKYTLVTISNMNKCIIDINKGERISPDIYNNSSKKLYKGDVLVSRNASLGKITLINKDFNGILNGGISYLRIKKKSKYYVVAFFLLDYGTDYLTALTSGGGTQKNAKRQNLLDVNIPFPTKKNHSNPDLVKEYISIITQNIIDKEEQIEAKLHSINEIFEKEILNPSYSFKYKYPNKEELIKKENRLDTGLYKKQFKNIVESVSQYSKGSFKLSSLSHKWISGSTPSVLIESNLKSDINWIAVADINYGLTYKRLKSFKLQDKINKITDGDILITRKGATVGKMIIYFDTEYKSAFVNEDLKVLHLKTDITNKIFIGLFLNSKYGQTQLLSNGSKGTKQGLTNPNILSVIVPNFDTKLKEEIATYYYNPQPFNMDLTIENYIEKEKERNSKVGLSELNLESFKLKEKLKLIIERVIKDEKIEIDL